MMVFLLFFVAALAGSHDQLHRENPFCSHLIDVVASIASATQALLVPTHILTLVVDNDVTS